MRIAIFAGRKHHFEKLQHLAAYLAIEREHDVFWLIANNSINIDPPEAYLANSGMPYLHLYHYALKVGRRTDLMTETLARLPEISPYWISASITEAIEVGNGFKNLVAEEGIDALLVLHTNNFWAKQLAFLSQEAKIPCYAFQEGILRDDDQESMHKQTSAGEYCEKIFTWSSKAKAKYKEAGISPRKLAVTGPPHLDRYTYPREDARAGVNQYYGRHPETPIITFAPPLLNYYRGNFPVHLKLLSKYARELRLPIVVKMHPFEPSSNVRMVEQSSQWIVTYPGDTYNLLRGTDVLLVQHSTVSIEGLALGAQVLEFNLDGLALQQPLHETGLVDVINSPLELNKITQRLADPIEVEEDLLKDYILADSDACSRISRIIEKKK